MATVTASILVGTAHQNDGGIIPTHQLFLAENSRPTWSLLELNSGNQPIVRIPTIDHMLEDALLMVGLFVVKDPKVVEAANAVRKEFSGRVQMYDDINETSRAKLFQLCREIGPQTKLVITVFEGSTIIPQLPVLDRYRFSVEVCRAVFRREYSAWSEKVEVSGSLI